MKKRYLKLLFISMAVLLMIVGCSKKDEKTDENQVENEQLDEAETKLDGEKTPENVDPNKVELMNELSSETVGEDDFLTGVRSKDGDWHNIELVFSDEYIEKLKDMSANEREAELKEYRQKVYEDLAKSNVLFYQSDDDTITFYYLDEAGKEFIDKTEVTPD